MKKNFLVAASTAFSVSCANVNADMSSHRTGAYVKSESSYGLSNLAEPQGFIGAGADVTSNGIDLPLEDPNKKAEGSYSIPVNERAPAFHFSAPQTEAEAVGKFEAGSKVITVFFEERFGLRSNDSSLPLHNLSNELYQADFSQDVPQEDIRALERIQGKGLVFEPIVNELSIPESEAIRIKLLSNRVPGDESPSCKTLFSVDMRKFNVEDMRAVFNELKKMSCVKRVLVQGLYEKTAATYGTTPSDPFFPNQSTWAADDLNNPKFDEDMPATRVQSWWYNRHSFAPAWTFSQGSVKVAIIDDCFRTDGPYDGAQWDHANKYHFKFAIPDVNPTTAWASEHGSECSLLIGAAANNGVGLCGGAPGVTMVPLAYDTSVSAQAVSAVYWAMNSMRGIKVISHSYHGEETSVSEDPMRLARSNAFNANVNCVYTAGNLNQFNPYDPLKFSSALCVGGINAGNQPFYAYSSNPGDIRGSGYGPRVDIAAAAQRVSVSSLTGFGFNTWKIKTKQGTSYAAPLVAASLAMVRSLGMNAAQARSIVIGSSDWTTANVSVPVGVPSVPPKEMASHYGYGSSAYGSDGLPKVRVLNAHAANWVAYQGATARCVYRPASSDYTQTKAVGGAWSFGVWHPANLLVTLSGATTVEVWEYNDGTNGTIWAGSHSTFKNGALQNYCSRGVPVHRSATGAVVTNPINVLPNANTTGWVNGQYVAVP